MHRINQPAFRIPKKIPLIIIITTIIASYFVKQCAAQTFTERERSEIMARHRRKLEQASLRLIDEQLSLPDGKRRNMENRFKEAVNYEGYYAPTIIANITVPQNFTCADSDDDEADHQAFARDLRGFDYKRHNGTHHLLCYTTDRLMVRIFEIDNQIGIRFTKSGTKSSPIKIIENNQDDDDDVAKNGEIRRAQFYRRFDTDQLYVVVLFRRGPIYAVETFEVRNEAGSKASQTSNTSSTENESIQLWRRRSDAFEHTFRFTEIIVKIDVLHYGVDKIRLIALLDERNVGEPKITIDENENTQQNEKEEDDEKEFEKNVNNQIISKNRQKSTGSMIRVRMHRGSHLATFRVKTSGFVIAGNRTHWFAYRLSGEDSSTIEQIVRYVSASPIVDIRSFTNGNRYFVAIIGEQTQYIYEWNGHTFAPFARTFQKNVYRISIISASYVREDIFFYYDRLHHDLKSQKSNRTDSNAIIYRYDINQHLIDKISCAKNYSKNFEMIFDSGANGVAHFSAADSVYELKMNDSRLFLFRYRIAIDDDDGDHESAGYRSSKHHRGRRTKRDSEQSLFKNKIDHLHREVRQLENRETISRESKSLRFDFSVRFNAKIRTRRIVSQDRSLPRYWILNKHRNNNDQQYRYQTNEFTIPLERLNAGMHETNQLEAKIRRYLEDEVVYRSSDAMITGIKEFVGYMQAPLVNALRFASIDTYRGRAVGEILGRLYRTSTNVAIGGRKRLIASTGCAVHRFLRVSTVNRIAPEHMLYGALDQDVRAPLWYRHLSVDRLALDDAHRLAANRTIRDTIFINDNLNDYLRPIEIRNRILFSRLDADRLYVETIDNHSISRLPEMVLRRNERKKAQIFRLPVRIGTMNVRGDMRSDRLNGFVSSDLFGNLVRKNGGISNFDKPVRIRGDARFRYMNLDGRLNGVRVPDDLLDRNSEQTIRGEKKFSQISAKNLRLHTLNEIRFSDGNANNRNDQDIITLSRDETIISRGPIALDRLRLAGNLHVNGLIDRVNLTHLDQRYISSLKNNYQNLTFTKPVHVKWLKVGGRMNGFDIENAYRDAILNHSANVQIEGAKTLRSILKCDSIRAAGTINGLPGLDRFVTTLGGDHFEIQKITFKNLTQFANMQVTETIDQVPIGSFVQQIDSLHQSDRAIFGSKRFNETIVVDRLFVDGTINRIAVPNFMLYSREQAVTGAIHFADVQVDQLSTEAATDLRVGENLNSHNFTQMLDSLIWLENEDDGPVSKSTRISPQIGTIVCVNCSAPALFTTYVNGQNFSYFEQNYFSKSRHQTIRSDIVFRTPSIRFGDIGTRNGAAGVNISQLHREAITLNGHNIVRNVIRIEGGDLRLLNGRLVCDNFNGINVTEFNEKVVHNNVNNVTAQQHHHQHHRDRNREDIIRIHGNVIYRNGFDLHADLRVNQLNGAPPEQTIMTTTGNYTIRARTNFAQNIITSGNVKIDAQINGINLTHLDRNMLKTAESDGALNGSINFLRQIRVHELAIHGAVDGIPVDRRTILWSNRQQNVHELTFAAPVHLDRDLNVWRSLNGYQHDNLNKIVRIDSTRTQIINASLTFTSVSAVQIEQSQGEVHIGIVNGQNLHQFERLAVYPAPHHRAAVIAVPLHFAQNLSIFSRNLTVHGTINGINLPHDIIRLDLVNQTITGVKTFERINANDDIEIHGLVNDIRLPDVQNNILYDVGQQEIPRQLTFGAPVYLAADATVQTLNGIEPGSLLTLGGADQQANGQLRFDEIRVDQTQSKLVNHINLTDIREHVWYRERDYPQHLRGEITVNVAQFDDDVNLRYHLNNVDLNVAVEAAQTELQRKFDVQNVASGVREYANRLHQQRRKYEHAMFEIERLHPYRFSAIDSANVDRALGDMKHSHIFGSSLATFRDALFAAHRIHLPIYQSMILAGKLHATILHHRSTTNRDRIVSMHLLRLDGSRLTTLARRDISLDSKPLMFAMDGAAHILYTMPPTSSWLSSSPSSCQNRTNNNNNWSYLERISPYDHIRIAPATVVQHFAETNVIGAGHFVDASGYHHLVFATSNLAEQSLIRIYKRIDLCAFELTQSLSLSAAADGDHNQGGRLQAIALFKFGRSADLIEQYLATLDRDRLTLWQHQGILGFSQNWSFETSANRTASPFAIYPFLQNYRLLLYAPTCVARFFEAHLNGNYTDLRLLYDDYL